jgi:hypothetical protein
MFCWNCGKKNPDDNRFCGECGKSLARDNRQEVAETVATGEAHVPRTAQISNPFIDEPRAVREQIVPPRTTAPVAVADPPPPPASSLSASQHRISGPSFLGLSDESSRDEPAEDSDYLLDDEASERSSWRGWLALLLFILIGVLVWKQWSVIRDSARALGERAGISRPAPAPAPVSKDVTSPPPTVSEGNITVNEDTAGAKPIERQTTPQAEPSPSPKASDNSESAESSSSIPPEDVEEENSKSSAPANPPRASTPAAASQDAQVELAQRYLQGRGVAQDCARGVSLLRSASSKESTRARIQLGALYATGHCVTQDRAVAYRWFAKAQELEPDNSFVTRNMDSLWAQMSTTERRRAEEQ